MFCLSQLPLPSLPIHFVWICSQVHVVVTDLPLGSAMVPAFTMRCGLEFGFV